MTCQYEILVIDLDGTLLSANGTVSDRNRRALIDARNSGLEVIIATGRAWSESRRFLEQIDYTGFLVAAGGSLFCEGVTGRTIIRHTMPPELVRQLAEQLLSHNHKVLILKDAHATGYDYVAVGSGALDPASKWWFDHLGVHVEYVDDIEKDGHPSDTVRVGVVADGQRLAPLTQDLRRKLGHLCTLQHWGAVTASHAIGSDTHLLEIFMPDVNKWTMVRDHCAQIGVDTTRVAAIGDGVNDVELLTEVGLGVAMANAHEDVARCANRMTVDHNADGVAVAVENILSGDW